MVMMYVMILPFPSTLKESSCLMAAMTHWQTLPDSLAGTAIVTGVYITKLEVSMISFIWLRTSLSSPTTLATAPAPPLQQEGSPQLPLPPQKWPPWLTCDDSCKGGADNVCCKWPTNLWHLGWADEADLYYKAILLLELERCNNVDGTIDAVEGGERGGDLCLLLLLLLVVALWGKGRGCTTAKKEGRGLLGYDYYFNFNFNFNFFLILFSFWFSFDYCQSIPHSNTIRTCHIRYKFLLVYCTYLFIRPLVTKLCASSK